MRPNELIAWEEIAVAIAFINIMNSFLKVVFDYLRQSFQNIKIA